VLPPLSDDEARRYARQTLLAEVGEEGQRRLKAARVLVVGAGGLGSPVALYLAAAGVGRIGLVDSDRVELSNLHRQVLFATGDLGRGKVDAAAERLRGLNPEIEVVAHRERFTPANALDLVRAYDVVADGTDNFPTRYLVNDACVLAGRPNVFASVLRFAGQATVFWPGHGPCYRCLFPEPPKPGLVPSCGEAGVLGALPGLLGAIQATEVLKLLLGAGEPLIGRLLLVDTLAARFREIRFPRRPDCPACGEGATPTLVPDSTGDAKAGQPHVAAGPVPAGPSQATPTCDAAPPEPLPWEIPVEELRRWREEGRPHLLLDVRTPREHAFAAIAGDVFLPLHELPERLDDLPRDRPIVVYCHLGGRSAQAVGYLRGHGFPQAINLEGGIDAWSATIDPVVPRY